MEVILLDYGSDTPQKEEASTLCVPYPFLQYYFTETEGWFWNRSQALNTALGLVKGEYVMVLDADIILVKGLIPYLLEQANEHSYWVYKYVYLPEHFKDYAALWQDGARYQKKFVHSADTAVGTIFAPRTAFEKAGLYDDFYCIWGKEDLDFCQRLDALPLQRKVLRDPQYFSYHQWHPHAQLGFPRGWLQVLERWEQDMVPVKDLLRLASPPPRILTLQDRPALTLFRAGSYTQGKQVAWFAPWVYASMEWVRTFQDLNSGEWLYGSFQNPRRGLKISSGRKFLKKQVDKILSRWQLTLGKTDDDMLDIEAFWYLRDFLYYFIISQQKDLQDYYLRVHAEEIFFIGIKR